MIESEYIAETGEKHRKNFAQFFTPKNIADFMLSWVTEINPNSILEPAYGLGILTRDLGNNENVKIVGYELDGLIFSKNANSPNRILHNQDFMESGVEKYDGIICNPPYKKYNTYSNKYLNILSDISGIRLHGKTNLYGLFLMKSILQMEYGGRLAFIIPSDFLKSESSAAIRCYITAKKILKHLIVFESNVFMDANTTACILLCENNENGSAKVSKIKDHNDLTWENIEDNSNNLSMNVGSNNIWEVADSPKANGFIMGDFAKCVRGIATGNNSFFVLSKEDVVKIGLPPESVKPCISKSEYASNGDFSSRTFAELAETGKKCYLLDALEAYCDANVQSYIQYGETMGYDKTYLTSKRKPWYKMEDRKPSPILISAFFRDTPKVVRNSFGASNLAPYHCIYPKNVDADVLYGYLISEYGINSILRNKRLYGGGLMKIEPNDVNTTKIPLDLNNLSAMVVLEIKGEVRKYLSDNSQHHIENITKIFARWIT